MLEEWDTNSRARAKSAFLTLVAGKPHELRLEYFEAVRDAEVRLSWRLPDAKAPFEEALDAARAAETVVFVGGLTGDVEGEEMRVPYPSFAGGDRTDLTLPGSQQKLLEAVRATGKPVVLVLMTGSALAVNWADHYLPAIVLAWYPGQQGGNAIADVLFGDVSPAGRLPVKFYKSVDQLPPFADYDMEGRTYRYFRGEALYPFGHGRSYTRFEYSGLRLDKPRLLARDSLDVTATVKNVGVRDGDEVVQLYVRDPESPRKMPIRELRGFARVSLRRGEAQPVRFRLSPAKDFTYCDADKKAYAVEPGDFEVQLGASSQDIRLTGRVRVDP